jgi:hypothetical protein
LASIYGGPNQKKKLHSKRLKKLYYTIIIVRKNIHQFFIIWGRGGEGGHACP